MSSEQSVSQKLGKGKLFIYVSVVVFVIILGAVFNFLFKDKIKDDEKNNYPSASDLKEVNVEKLGKDNLVLNSASYPPESVINITNFEENENTKWQGSGVFDEKVNFEGDRSLSLVSIDHNEMVTYLKKDIDLSNMEYFELMVNVSDISALEAVSLELGDLDMKNYYQYIFTNLVDGWNLVQIPKSLFVPFVDQAGSFGWQNIQKIQFKATSRMGAMVIVRFDMFNAVNNSYNFVKDWRVRNDNHKKFLTLIPKGNVKRLSVRAYGASTAILDNKRNVKDFIMSATISPESSARSGLFIRGNYNNNYGYYFLIGGDRDNHWQIKKLDENGWLPSEQEVKGDIGNDVFQKGKDYWLRVEGRGNVMQFLLSFDGTKYLKLGETKDSEFRSGGLGITILDSGWSTFDNVMVKEF